MFYRILIALIATWFAIFPAAAHAALVETPANKIFSESEFYQLKSLAEMGDVNAQVTVGNIFYYGSEHGQCVPRNYEQAFKWFKKAADQGSMAAQYYLGEMYYNARAVKKDYAEAIKWYRKAADQGDPRAYYNLGVFYKYGWGVAHDDTESIKWFRMAAEHGIVVAQSYLAEAYEKGQGVPQSTTEATKFYLLSADHDPIDRPCGQPVLFVDRRDVGMEDSEVLKWFQKEAYQDSSCAQNTLAYIYANGLGVKSNVAEAIKWYRRAADGGLAMAQHNLGLMYAKGIGVDQNYEEAYFWYRLAAVGNRFYANSLQDLSALLTPAQFRAAGKRVEEWKPATKGDTKREPEPKTTHDNLGCLLFDVPTTRFETLILAPQSADASNVGIIDTKHKDVAVDIHFIPKDVDGLAGKVGEIRKNIESEGYVIGNLLETPTDYHFQSSIIVGDVHVFDVRLKSAPSDAYELWIGTVTTKGCKGAVSMLTEGRNKDFLNWARNIEIFREVIQSLRERM